ncbi:hypothetical protein L218DRAFT_967897 [Marasmius fiardii PR-910]|nr:hypothetical protein L218DRAFT_967897 [Marasmius fiardii PR-910]
MSTTTDTTTCYNLCGCGNGSIQTAPATTDTQTMGSTVVEQLAAVNNGESPNSSLSAPPSVSHASLPGVCTPEVHTIFLLPSYGPFSFYYDTQHHSCFIS